MKKIFISTLLLLNSAVVLGSQKPLLEKVTLENIKKAYLEYPAEKQHLQFMEGVLLCNEGKYHQANSVLTKISKLEYLQSYLSYYKGLSTVESFNDELSLKKGLKDLYYAGFNNTVLSDLLKDKLPKYELKLSKVLVGKNNCQEALFYYSQARAKNFSDLKEEFNIVNRYYSDCDKQMGLSMFLDLYSRFGNRLVLLINNSEVKSAIDNWKNSKELIPVMSVGVEPVTNQEMELFNDIKSSVAAKNYADFVKKASEYLKLYASSSQKFSSKFYSNFATFIDNSIAQKTKEVSYFDKVLERYEQSPLEKMLFKYWQKEDWKTSEYIAKLITENFPGNARAYYLRASLYEDMGQFKKAYDSYKYIVDHFEDQRNYPSALFKTAWIKMMDSKYKDCVNGFDRYIKESADRVDWAVTSAYYFKARCLDAQDKKTDGMSTKKELISKYPFSFYSLLAMDEMDMKIPDELDTRIKPQAYITEPASAFDINTFNTAMALLRLGFKDFVRKELSNLDLEKIPTEFIERIIKVYVYAGMNDMAMQTSSILLNKLKVFVSREHVEYHYPKHYYDFVNNYANKKGLDPFVMFSIMKRESAFNKDAVSRAGAIGLMQLMPATASRFQPSISKDKIRDAETNIRIASEYLNQLIKKYNGNLIYASAAYNAGEEAVNRWVKWYGSKLRGVDFIENIPYIETRAYVKSVLGNYFMYNAVYLNKHISFSELIREVNSNAGN